MKSRRMGLRLITKARLRRKDREIKQAWLCYRGCELTLACNKVICTRFARVCLKRFAVRHGFVHSCSGPCLDKLHLTRKGKSS